MFSSVGGAERPRGNWNTGLTAVERCAARNPQAIDDQRGSSELRTGVELMELREIREVEVEQGVEMVAARRAQCLGWRSMRGKPKC